MEGTNLLKSPVSYGLQERFRALILGPEVGAKLLNVSKGLDTLLVSERFHRQRRFMADNLTGQRIGFVQCFHAPTVDSLPLYHSDYLCPSERFPSPKRIPAKLALLAHSFTGEVIFRVARFAGECYRMMSSRVTSRDSSGLLVSSQPHRRARRDGSEAFYACTILHSRKNDSPRLEPGAALQNANPYALMAALQLITSKSGHLNDSRIYSTILETFDQRPSS